jgi:soluble lytic murein transglycosylase-like protein
MAVAPSVRAGEARVGSFDEELRTAAAREGIDADLVRAVAKVESGGNANAVSHAGAKGLMQLMDGTARSLGVTDSFDPGQNAAGGAKYLRQMLNRFGGDVTKALAAYNAGPGTVEKFGGVPPYSETQGYVRKVLQTREQLRRAGS